MTDSEKKILGQMTREKHSQKSTTCSTDIRSYSHIDVCRPPLVTVETLLIMGQSNHFTKRFKMFFILFSLIRRHFASADFRLIEKILKPGTATKTGAIRLRLPKVFLIKTIHSIISPLCLVWVRAPHWPHVRQDKFCLRVCKVVFPGYSRFAPPIDWLVSMSQIILKGPV